MKTYFISGLGADGRIFSQLTLHEQIEVIHLPWIRPEKNESIAHYAMRMAAKIDDPQHSALVGISFGGIMAIEISKQLNMGKTVLLNSVKHRGELPPHLRLVGLLGLHKPVPASFLLGRRALIDRFFGVDTPGQKNLLHTILEESDPVIVEWSIDRLVCWANEVVPEVIHIHGTADTVFPIRYVKADHRVKGGPHFMVLTHASEVSRLLNEVLLPQ